jgi:tetratricopeptide (TPR) repeat protein
VLARWADAARPGGRHDEAVRALGEAIDSFKSQGRPVEAARGMSLLADVLWFRGDPTTRAMAADAVSLLEAEGPSAELVDAYAEAGRLASLGGDFRQSLVWTERALALASELALPEPAKPLGYHGLARFALGDPLGVEDLRRALSLAVDAGQGWEAAILYNNLAVTQSATDGPAVVLETNRAGLDFCERRGITQTLHWLMIGELDCLFQLGSWDGITESAEELATRLEASGSVVTLIWVRDLRARVLIYRGNVSDALPLTGWAVDAARKSGNAESRIFARGTRALAALAEGDAEGATAFLREIDEMPHSREVGIFADFLPTMVRAAVGAGDVELARRLSSGLEPRYRSQQYADLAARAILAEADGETEEAAGLYGEAAERWKEFQNQLEQALALLGQGRCLVALGRPLEAAQPLGETREIFDRLGTAPMLAETDALLAQSTALTS